MKTGFFSMFYDAMGRIEPKMVIGLPMLTLAMVLGLVGLCGLFKVDWAGWSIFTGFCLGLVGWSAVGDSITDRAQIKAQATQSPQVPQ